MPCEARRALLGGDGKVNHDSAPLYPTVQEAIRVAVHRLSKGGNVGVTKKHILKALFLAKERLPDDNSVKRDLAYYWYMEGPYSEVVYANLEQMVKDGLVKPRKTSKSETYRLAPERALQPVW